jgi:hypothetical protein
MSAQHRPPSGGPLADISHNNAIAMIEANPGALSPKAFAEILAAHGNLDAAVADAVGWLAVLKFAGESKRAEEIGRQLAAALDDCTQAVGAVLDRQFVAPLSHGGVR